MDLDIRAYREALGSFPTGVAVVTAAIAADAANSKKLAHIGITVNSFTSVSLDPPLVLWCMDRKSGRHALFAAAPAFTVNILGTEHRGVSARLARPGEHALDGIALMPTELGPPALADSLAVFECAREQALAAGDHTILIGRVLRFSRHSKSAPLVYFGGRYSALAQARPPEGRAADEK
ncbi:MAG TPA: flavin reductase family protein [Rhizomicrobium sp.]|jgi:flavin reductase (DIM6/NTAB) family NADH-FMN oxidoreductase RutF|nr:flavin reductase family protein [Rhizomicrobium sp.]